MDNPQRGSLPEKCCVRCGFLYCLTLQAADRDNLIIDPDVIRTQLYQSIMADPAGLVSSLPFLDYKNRMQRVFFPNVEGFCCYLMQFEEISARKALSNDSGVVGEFVQKLHQDRSGCSDYFPYHRGFTAPQHTELLLEDRRTERQERHAKGLTIATEGLVVVTGVLVIVTAAPHVAPWILSLSPVQAGGALLLVAVTAIAGAPSGIAFVRSLFPGGG